MKRSPEFLTFVFVSAIIVVGLLSWRGAAEPAFPWAALLGALFFSMTLYVDVREGAATLAHGGQVSRRQNPAAFWAIESLWLAIALGMAATSIANLGALAR